MKKTSQRVLVVMGVMALVVMTWLFHAVGFGSAWLAEGLGAALLFRQDGLNHPVRSRSGVLVPGSDASPGNMLLLILGGFGSLCLITSAIAE